MAKWRRISTLKLPVSMNIYIPKIDTQNIVKLLYHTVKPLELKEFLGTGEPLTENNGIKISPLKERILQAIA